jgi:hypothetical protein
MNANDFIKELDAFGDQDVPGLVQTVHQKVTLEALTRLVSKTPVDTGRARGNWQVAIGDRPQGQVDVPNLLPHHHPPLPEPPALSVAGQTAVDEGQKIIATIRPFAVSHVANNVAYILKLEDGGSRQAPEGMLALTLEELTEMFP